MKKSELRQIIKEEIKDSLNGVDNLENKIASLYGYDSIKTQYDDDMIKRYGQNVIDMAVQMAPKILSYEAKLRTIVKEIENSPEAKMLLKVISNSRRYGGDQSPVELGDLINRYSKI
jgi:hypothetical protein